MKIHAAARKQLKKFLFLRALLLAQFAHALLSIGEPTRAADTARRAMAVAEEAGEAGNLAWAQLSAAQAALAMGRTEDARKFVEIATEAARARGMAPLLQRCDTLLDGIGGHRGGSRGSIRPTTGRAIRVTPKAVRRS